MALDAEVGNSTYAERFAAKHPDRFFEMYIAEQQMVAAAVGLQVRGWKPFASTFGAFLSRAYDFVRMAAISDADLKLCGSHVGVSIGADGPSQMALEDIASFRAVFGSVVLYPSDANQTVQLVDAMSSTTASATCADPRGDPGHLRGRRDLRDRRQPHPPLQRRRRSHPDRRRHHLARMPRRRRPTRRKGGQRPRHRPLLGQADRRRGRARRGRRDRALVTVEDHWPEGGIGETVAGVLAEADVNAPLVCLAVTDRPGSGPPEALLAAAGIDAAHIVSAVADGNY